MFQTECPSFLDRPIWKWQSLLHLFNVSMSVRLSIFAFSTLTIGQMSLEEVFLHFLQGDCLKATTFNISRLMPRSTGLFCRHSCCKYIFYRYHTFLSMKIEIPLNINSCYLYSGYIASLTSTVMTRSYRFTVEIYRYNH